MSVLKIKDQNNDWIQIPTIKGDKGDPFTYADFTPEQLESLKGKDGISPTVSVASDTSDDYRLSFTDETHTVTTPNLIPEAEKIFDVYPHDIASGAVASFPDGADDIPLKSCIVQVEPVQDLHGYDSPWPAGGGTNQWDEQWELGSFDSYGNPTTSSSFMRSKNYIPLIPNATYYFTRPSIIAWVYYYTDTDYIEYVQLGSGVKTFTPPSNATRAKFLVPTSTYGTTYNHDIAINYPSAVTTYSPYENICPISGWTGCEVQRTGKNLLNLVESEMVSNGWNRIFPISLKAGTYIISCQNQFGASTKGAAVALVDDSGANVIKLLSGYEFGDSTFVGRAATITEEEASNIKNLRFSLRESGATYNDVVQGNIQLELGSTATDYEPYQGNTYLITFPSEAGTVYGAYVDVINGELVVDRAMVTLDEDDIIGINVEGQNCRVIVKSGKISIFDSYRDGVCNKAVVKTSWAGVAGDTSAIGINNPKSNQFVTNRAIGETLQEIKDFVGIDGLQICTYLATSITYQLTPQEIKTLLGQNNLWADTGDTEVEYRASTKMYIDRKITEAVASALNS